MTLQFFSAKPSDGDGRRSQAVNTVIVWLWGRRHLPKDLTEALHYLIPELGRGGRGTLDDDISD